MKININDFYEKFKKEYNFLYENNDRVAGYFEALDYGEHFIKKYPEFVKEFVVFRGDCLTSDREIVAFAFTLESFGVV